MTVGDRIKQRLADLNMSQSELARRVGINQSTVAALLAGRSRSSSHLHKIARNLHTTPSYLTGEIDDPEEGASNPLPVPRTQVVMMPVGMPSEDALAQMYEGQLRVFAKLSGAELARALAKRLPRALARLQAADVYEDLDRPPVDSEDGSPQPEDRPLAQQSRHT